MVSGICSISVSNDFASSGIRERSESRAEPAESTQVDGSVKSLKVRCANDVTARQST